MRLKDLDAAYGMLSNQHHPHSPHILIAMDALQSCWNGEYDTEDLITVLARESGRLLALARALEKNTENRSPDGERNRCRC